MIPTAHESILIPKEDPFHIDSILKEIPTQNLVINEPSVFGRKSSRTKLSEHVSKKSSKQEGNESESKYFMIVHPNSNRDSDNENQDQTKQERSSSQKLTNVESQPFRGEALIDQIIGS